jgi:uncharacterized membrane protein YjjP (DUF1212 family)
LEGRWSHASAVAEGRCGYDLRVPVEISSKQSRAAQTASKRAESIFANAETGPIEDRFLAVLARLLHEAGTPSHRIESIVSGCAERLGIKASIFSLPTWISISVDDGGAQRTTNFRVDPGSPKMALLEETFRVADRVSAGELDAAGGLSALRIAYERLWRPPSIAMTLGYALFSAAAARLLGGTVDDMIVALPVGFCVGFSLRLAAGRRERELLAEFGGAFVATLLAVIGVLVATRLGLHANVGTIALAGIVTLLPGLSLTTAMSELSARNLASGSARLMGAVTSLVVIAMGVAVGEAAVRLFGAPPPSEHRGPSLLALSFDTATAVALFMGALGIAIAFHARPQRFWLVLASSILGYIAARISRNTFDAALAPVAAAAFIGVAGNIYSWWRRRPTGTIVLPAIALLLPGSIGFRGMRDLISRDSTDTLAGLDTFTHALLIAASIAAGLLIANALVPRRVHA